MYWHNLPYTKTNILNHEEIIHFTDQTVRLRTAQGGVG